ncbi:MAG: choice-of-anchor Q domain-containing protein [Candidatus Saccharimonadales bacterium]
MKKILQHTVRPVKKRPYHAASLLLLLISAAVVWAINSSSSSASGLTNANLWVDSDGGTCTRQSSAGAYVDAAACSSIEAAVAASSPGDSIAVKLGSYGNETITSSSSWPGVNIVADDGTTVGTLTVNGSWLTIQNMTITSLSMGHVAPASIPTNVTLKNVDSTDGGLIEGGRNIAWIGGNIGPHANDADSTLGLQGIGPNCIPGGGAGCNPLNKVLLDGLHFTDITRSGACISANCFSAAININNGVDGLTVKNSTFDGTNDVNAGLIYFGDNNYGALAKNVTFESNFFGDPVAASDAITGGNCSNHTIALWYNTFNSTAGWDNSSFSGCGSQLSSVGNIGKHPTCLSGMTFSYNVWTNGTCGGSDTNTGSLGLGGSDGFHLTNGSAAIDAGDPGDYPATDHDGNTRFAGVAPDAGADEYGATGSGSITAPANTALPALSGTAMDGNVLTASNGTWSGSAASYLYQWQRCDTGGSNCTDISGAVDSTYTLVPADDGNTVRAIVVASNAAGVASARSTQSSSIAGAPPSNTSLPSISGTAAVTGVLSTTNGAWTGSPIYSYQWQRCTDNTDTGSCSNISGATNGTYTLVLADQNMYIRSVVTATNGAGSDTATSAASNIVQAMIGDFNDDGVVNLFDLVVFLGHWQSGSSPVQDLNSDGIVNESDLVVFLGHYSE